MELTSEQIKNLEDFQQAKLQKQKEREASIERLRKISAANRFWIKEMAKQKQEKNPS